MMKDSLRIVIVLTVVCLVCSLLLSVVSSLAKEKTEYNQREAVKRALFNIVSQCRNIEEVTIKDKVLYKLFDVGERIIGYGILAEGQGYQGKIRIMAVINPDFSKLSGIEVIESQETPGLGARINEESFKQQFRELSVESPIECIKEEILEKNQIKAITGATISSEAVVNILNKEIKELVEIREY